MTAWTEFLKANAGKGYTRKELTERYRRNVPLTQLQVKATSKPKAKAKPNAKPNAKPKAKAAKPKSKATKKGVAKQTVMKEYIKEKKASKIKETPASISIGDLVVVNKAIKSSRKSGRNFPIGITWDCPPELRNSVATTRQFIEDLRTAIDLVEKRKSK